jgi:hypothetical protein
METSAWRPSRMFPQVFRARMIQRARIRSWLDLAPSSVDITTSNQVKFQIRVPTADGGIQAFIWSHVENDLYRGVSFVTPLLHATHCPTHARVAFCEPILRRCSGTALVGSLSRLRKAFMSSARASYGQNSSVEQNASGTMLFEIAQGPGPATLTHDDSFNR